MGYPGNKQIEGVYHRIINEIPPHLKYVELFLGSGAIMRNKLPAQIGNWGVEIDDQTLKDEKWYQYAERHSRYFILKMSAINFLREKILKLPASLQQEYFIYADPPYPISSRRSQENLYRCEMSDQEHVEFLKLAKKVNCSMAISTYGNPIYTKLLKGWRVIEYKVNTRRGIATELLYMNYAPPKQLHDYRFLGKDFVERQMIKRKISRHVARLKNLPALERAAIIREIFRENPNPGSIPAQLLNVNF